MSQNSENKIEDQQIDLLSLFKHINLFFEKISIRFFKGILFLQRNLLVIGILFVIGVAVGFYMDKSKKVYENKVIVTPNFDSSDYLYSKIELINSKIKEGDTLFLKNVVGIKKPTVLNKIEIKPIIDVYKFIDDKKERENKELTFEMIKLMADGGDINKILENPITSKNYIFHEIIFITSRKISNKEIVEPLLKYLNNSEFFLVMLKESQKNLKLKIAANDSIISQVSKLLNSLSSTRNNQKAIFFNENNQLGDVLRMIDGLNIEQGKNRLDLIRKSKVVKESNTAINIKKQEVINGRYKFIMPFIFILAFIFTGAFRSYYRRQLVKLNA